jgi:fumarylpyruvate hydrolase
MSQRFVFDPPPCPALPVNGSDDVFPVRRVWCVAKNYAEHAREMGADPAREPPRFFAKPADAVVPSGEAVPYPPATAELHHEVELVLALGRGGAFVAEADALGLVFGCGVGLDLTRRDLQREAKAAGGPWDLSKGFDRSAPCSALQPGPPPASGELSLTVNGVLRQRGELARMIWSPAEIIGRLSRYVALGAGDLIFTGTPAGVGPLVVGDRVAAALAGVGALELEIAPTLT